MKELREQDYDALVKNADKPVVLKFTADWWPACKQLDPVAEKVAGDLEGQVDIYSVNTDNAPGIARQFGIMSIPTMVLMKNGEEAARLNGFVPEPAIKQFATQ